MVQTWNSNGREGAQKLGRERQLLTVPPPALGCSCSAWRGRVKEAGQTSWLRQEEREATKQEKFILLLEGKTYNVNFVTVLVERTSRNLTSYLSDST